VKKVVERILLGLLTVLAASILPEVFSNPEMSLKGG